MPSLISSGRTLLYNPPVAVAAGGDFDNGTNLLTGPSVFGSAPWSLVLGTVSTDSTTDSDGGSTADTWVENSSNGVHRLVQDVTKAASSLAYTLVVRAKAASGSRRLVLVLRRGDDASGVYTTFDIQGGALGTAVTAFGSGWSGGTASILSLGSGWYRCQLAGVTTDTSTTIRTDIELDNGTGTAALSNSYTGNSTSGLYLYKAALTQP